MIAHKFQKYSVNAIDAYSMHIRRCRIECASMCEHAYGHIPSTTDRISNKFDKRITIANKAVEADPECQSNYRCNFRCNAAIQDELYN